MELVRAILFQKGLPKLFRAEAINVPVHVRNRLTTRGLPSAKTPYQVMFGIKARILYLRVFGSQSRYTTTGRKG